MNNYIPSYYDELNGYLMDNEITIKDRHSSLDRMRNILVDLRDEILNMTSGVEVAEEIEGVLEIIFSKINRRIIYIDKTIDNLLLIPKYLDPEKYSYLKEEE